MKQLKIVLLSVAALFAVSWALGSPIFVSATIGILGCLAIFSAVAVFEKRLTSTEDRKTISDLKARIETLEDRVKTLSSVAQLREVVRGGRG